MTTNPVDVELGRYQNILKLRGEGFIAREISEELGCTESEVSNAVQRMKAKGISVPKPVRKRQPTASDIALERLAKMCED